jgi:hypothetical protein
MKSTTGQELAQAPFIDEESIPVLLGSGKSRGKVGNYLENELENTGKLVNSTGKSGKFPRDSGSISQNLPFSTDEIDAFRLLIEDGKIGKTEIVKLMPGYSGREHKRFIEYYEIIQRTVN